MRIGTMDCSFGSGRVSVWCTGGSDCRRSSGTIVAHKTGTTGTVQGFNGSTNDVGVITLPGNAGRLAIAVYIKGSSRSEAVREKVIAQIARAAFDAYALQ